MLSKITDKPCLGRAEALKNRQPRVHWGIEPPSVVQHNFFQTDSHAVNFMMLSKTNDFKNLGPADFCFLTKMRGIGGKTR